MEGKVLKKITPETLIQSIVEIRFSTSIPVDAIFGMIYSTLKDTYPNLNNSDVLQLPPHVRNSDPRIKYQVHHTIYNENISIGIGPSVILFNCIGEYIGWDQYFSVLKEEMRKIFKLSILNKVQRIGLRYMSFFEGQRNFFDNVNINVHFENSERELEETSIRTVTRLGDANQYRATLQLNDKITLENEGNINEGSLVDIDVAYEMPFSANYDKLMEIINSIHSEVKQLFQNLLKKEFIEKYNPEYYD